MANMKYLKTLGLSAMAILTFTACSNDYNYDEDYDINGYYNGTDPRTNIVNPVQTVYSVTDMYTSAIHLEPGAKKHALKLRMRRAIDQEVDVQLRYDADAPLLASTYKGYQLGTADMISFDNGGLVKVAANSLEATDSFSVSGYVGKAEKPIVIPFSCNVQQSGAAVANATNKYVYVVIGHQAVTITSKVANMQGTVALSGGKASFIGTTTMSATVATDVNGLMTNGRTFDVKGELTNVDKFTAKGMYIIPVKVNTFDVAGKAYTLGTYFIEVGCIEPIVEASATEVAGNEIPRQGWKATSNPASIQASLMYIINDDDDDYMYTYLKSIEATFDLGAAHTIKGLNITADDRWGGYSPQVVTLYISEDGVDFEQISGPLQYEDTNPYFYLKATKPFTARYVKLKLETSNYGMVLQELHIVE
jgi:F5/8 type C domain.